MTASKDKASKEPVASVTVADIQSAKLRIAGHVQRTPMPRSAAISELTKVEVYCKLENLQRTGSFKERGALNKLSSLNSEQRARGVITASAGNHAQGVALWAQRLGIPATVVMPELSPLVKVKATREFGAEVILHGETFDDAFAKADELCTARNLVFVHAFDDPLVVAGQGTIGLEILEDLPNVDAVLVAIGGGGLASGIGCAIKALRPEVEIIGVQSSAVTSMVTSLERKELVTVPPARTIADGIAVRKVGALTLKMAREYVDRIVTVDDEEIANAILQLLEKEKTVAEGAGAAPMAALLHRDLGLVGKRVAVLVCGGNINVNLISRIIERGLIKDGRRVRLRVIVPDRPGMLSSCWPRSPSD
jgi:threonine dehydratase